MSVVKVTVSPDGQNRWCGEVAVDGDRVVSTYRSNESLDPQVWVETMKEIASREYECTLTLISALGGWMHGPAIQYDEWGCPVYLED